VYADTDHAGCLRTRKSTSGGCVVMGSQLMKSWSSTQPVITLSSGEAELYGVVRAAANGLGYLSLLADFGVRIPLRVWTDSTASVGICSRQGLGKVRHLAVQELWVQQRIRNQDFALYKVAGEDNPADLFTKAGLSQERIRSLLTALGCEFRGGRAASAPALRQEGGTKLFHIGGLPKQHSARRIRAKGGMTRWADIEDAEDRLYTSAEVEDMVKQFMPVHSQHSEDQHSGQQHSEEQRSATAKLPHQRAIPTAVSPPMAYPELQEPEDSLTEHGLHIGQQSAGRGGLPSRLRHA
jgi:hypothetical protein